MSAHDSLSVYPSQFPPYLPLNLTAKEVFRCWLKTTAKRSQSFEDGFKQFYLIHFVLETLWTVLYCGLIPQLLFNMSGIQHSRLGAFAYRDARLHTTVITLVILIRVAFPTAQDSFSHVF